MSEALVPVLTTAGLAAVANAQGTGLQVVIDRVAIGRGRNSAGKYIGYTPSKAATALAGEMARVPILSGRRLDPGGFRILAQLPAESSDTEYPIQEVGFYTATGVLFALWSAPTGPLAYHTRLADVDLSFDLLLNQIPADALDITVLEPDIPDLAGVCAAILRENTNHFIASLAMNERMIDKGL